MGGTTKKNVISDPSLKSKKKALKEKDKKDEAKQLVHQRQVEMKLLQQSKLASTRRDLFNEKSSQKETAVVQSDDDDDESDGNEDQAFQLESIVEVSKSCQPSQDGAFSSKMSTTKLDLNSNSLIEDNELVRKNVKGCGCASAQFFARHGK